MAHIDPGDTAFLLTSTALVLLMSPGLAFFYGGFVRRKNVLNTIAMSFASMAAVGAAWLLLGYSIAFSSGPGPLDGIVGGVSFAGWRGVGAEPNALYAATVPHLAFALYQGMFAIITPALISGAVAERMRFVPYVLFSVLWSLLVYAPVAHWAWAPGGWLRGLGVLDFAGGTVVHINAAAAALVAARLVGPRRGFPRTAFVPHQVPFILLGTGLLWFGWLGFNGGSALAAGPLAAGAFATTFAAAAGAGLSWALLDLRFHGHVTAVGLASGIVAGLVAVTPAAGFVTPLAALGIGFATSLPSFLVLRWKRRLGLDDALDVFGIHGVSGIFGALATGLLATKQVNEAGADGGLALLGWQLLACLATLAYSGLASFALLKAIGRVMPLRLDEHAEFEGADLSEHGERAYAELDGVFGGPHRDTVRQADEGSGSERPRESTA